jgi:pSer/pThr/pTyr-binding forkhead associated (FHA) protein
MKTTATPTGGFAPHAEALPSWLQAIPEAGRAEATPQIRLFITKSRRMAALSLAQELQIGRADPKRNVRPDLDLTADGALDAGVSRMHAAIQRQNGEVVVVDLGSANGTRLNGVELLPNRAQPLSDGDELELGALHMRVYLDG